MDIILNKNREILHKLKELIENTKQIDISVSYITTSGWQHLQEEIYQKDKKIRVITTFDDYITQPELLRKMISDNIDVRIIGKEQNQRGFHSKFIFFKQDNKNILFNGSLNITKEAFENKFELITINEVLKFDEFDYLWNISTKLTNKIINNYEKDFLLYNDKVIIPSIEELKPNQMQISALNALKNHRRRGNNKALIRAATGTGKTILSILDIKEMDAKKVLFLVHRDSILSGAKKSFKKLLPDHRVSIMKGSSLDLRYDKVDIILTTDKSYFKRLHNKIPSNYFDYVIIDEAHRIGPKTIYKQILEKIEPKFLLGITATPERTDGIHVEKYFGFETPYEINIEEAISKKYLASFNYFGVTPNKNKDKFRDNTVSSKVSNLILELNKLGHTGNKLKGLLFCESINEAYLLTNELNKQGFESECLTSKLKMSMDDEADIIGYLEDDNNKLKFIVTVDKFNEGVDIPSINTVVFMRSTESKIIWLQQLGRGLRKYGHKTLTVIDFVGNDTKPYNKLISEPKFENRTLDKIIDDFNDNNFLNDKSIYFNLDRKSKESIFESIKEAILKNKYSQKKAYQNSIKNIKLINAKYNHILKNKKNISQIINTFGTLYSFTEETDDQPDLMKIIQTIPLTTTTIEEKKKIVRLLRGEITNFKDEKWNKYFSNSYIDHNERDRKYFTVTENKILFNKVNVEHKYFSHVESTIEILENQIKDGISDFLRINNYYSTRDIVFMLKPKYNKLAIQPGEIRDLPFNSKGIAYLVDVSLNKDEKKYKYENKFADDNFEFFTGKSKTLKPNQSQVKIMSNDIEMYKFITSKLIRKISDSNNKVYIYCGKIVNYKSNNKLNDQGSLKFKINQSEFKNLSKATKFLITEGANNILTK